MDVFYSTYRQLSQGLGSLKDVITNESSQVLEWKTHFAGRDILIMVRRTYSLQTACGFDMYISEGVRSEETFCHQKPLSSQAKKYTEGVSRLLELKSDRGEFVKFEKR